MVHKRCFHRTSARHPGRDGCVSSAQTDTGPSVCAAVQTPWHPLGYQQHTPSVDSRSPFPISILLLFTSFPQPFCFPPQYSLILRFANVRPESLYGTTHRTTQATDEERRPLPTDRAGHTPTLTFHLYLFVYSFIHLFTSRIYLFVYLSLVQPVVPDAVPRRRACVCRSTLCFGACLLLFVFFFFFLSSDQYVMSEENRAAAVMADRRVDVMVMIRF